MINNLQKYVGPERYLNIYKKITRPCTSCGQTISDDKLETRCLVTFVEWIINPKNSNEMTIKASLHGHSILNIILPVDSRCEFEK